MSNCAVHTDTRLPCAICQEFVPSAVASGYDAQFERMRKEKEDAVHKPKHYTKHPSGVECIEITRHMGFNLGNAVKYIWRCDLKKDAVEDLRKAIWYLQDEIKRRESA